MNENKDDSMVLERFLKGDTAAEKHIFKKFFKPLCLFADNLIDDVPAAEDLVSEAFITSFNKRERFNSIDNLKAYLYVSVRNASLNYLSSEKRKKNTIQQLACFPGFEATGLPNPVQNEILLAEIIHAIHLEIAALPDKCGIIFKKIFFEGLETDVIAAQLGINVQTVRTQKARAIQLIKTRLLRYKNVTVLTFLCLWINIIDTLPEAF